VLRSKRSSQWYGAVVKKKRRRKRKRAGDLLMQTAGLAGSEVKNGGK
jgi:hypothetical protein